MGSSNSCADNSDTNKNEVLQWAFQFAFIITFIILFMYIRKRLNLPLKSFGAVRFLFLQSMGVGNALTSISVTYFVQSQYHFCNASESDNVLLNIWLSFNILILIILLSVIYCELQMEKNNKIPQCILIPYTNNDCCCCDGCNQRVSSSKLAAKSDILKKWNWSRRLYSLLLTYIIFGLSIFFTPFYQLQNADNLCVCTAQFDLILIGFVLSFLTIPALILLTLTWFGWCCCKYLCKHNCCTAFWVGFYRLIAYSAAIIFPSIFVLLRLYQWAQHKFFRWTVTNIYIVLYVAVGFIGIVIGIVVFLKGHNSKNITVEKESNNNVSRRVSKEKEIELQVISTQVLELYDIDGDNYKWECTSCTYNNSNMVTLCGICGATKVVVIHL